MNPQPVPMGGGEVLERPPGERDTQWDPGVQVGGEQTGPSGASFLELSSVTALPCKNPPALGIGLQRQLVAGSQSVG